VIIPLRQLDFTTGGQASVLEDDIKQEYMYSKTYSVYIMSNKKGGTLYIGVTSDLEGRAWEHKNNAYKGFSNKYKTHNLVYHEEFEDINSAIDREKQLKKWNRSWKIKLIEEKNPNWEDLYNNL